VVFCTPYVTCNSLAQLSRKRTYYAHLSDHTVSQSYIVYRLHISYLCHGPSYMLTVTVLSASRQDKYRERGWLLAAGKHTRYTYVCVCFARLASRLTGRFPACPRRIEPLTHFIPQQHMHLPTRSVLFQVQDSLQRKTAMISCTRTQLARCEIKRGPITTLGS
jgi:hypothetical protein